MTAYAKRCEREDEEDRCKLIDRTIQACDPPSRDNHLCAICNTYIGGTSLVGLDTSDRMRIWTKSTDTSGS